MDTPSYILYLLWGLWLFSLVFMLAFAAPLLLPRVWQWLFYTIPTSPMPTTPSADSAVNVELPPIDAEPPAFPLSASAIPIADALQQPFPAYTVAAEPPTAKQLDALLASPYMQQLRARYTELQQQVEIADRFQEWAEKQPEGGSLLLSAQENTDYWFAGDLHASFETLLRAWAVVHHHAQTSQRKGCLILLGDIIDRGTEEFPCLAMIEELLLNGEQDGVRLLYLRGNHDTALWQDPRGNFRSNVIPAETAEALNTLRIHGPAGAAESIGRAAIALARTAPCMGELTHLAENNPNGCILFAHGGLPHVDLQEEAQKRPLAYKPRNGMPLFDSLPEEVQGKWAEDFIWIRLVDRLPHKKPNRGSYGNELGTVDVNSYRKLHLRLTGRAIGFILRGHDHEPAGYRLYSYDPVHNPARGTFVQKNCGVLTLNTMGNTSDNPVFAKARPALARVHREGALELYPLPGITTQA